MALSGAEILAFSNGIGMGVPTSHPSLAASHRFLAAEPQATPASQDLHSTSATAALAASTMAGIAALALRRARTGGHRNGSVARLSRAAVALSVGQKVAWKGKTGTVKYSGTVQFASGEWVGLELDEPQGLHDGTVLNIPYFQCRPKHGIFCQVSDLSDSGGAPSPAATSAPVASPVAAAGGGAVAVGQKVSWNGVSGTVQYFGKVDFAAGEWVGVQLDEPKGMHDGSVFNKSYFTCPPKTGIFCTPAEVGAGGSPVAAPASPVASTSPAVAQPAAGGAVAAASVGQRVSWKGAQGTVKYVGKVSFAPGEWVGVELDEPKGMHDGSLFGQTYFASKPKHGVFSGLADLQAGTGSAPSAAASSGHASGLAEVKTGLRVLWNDITGTVKYGGAVSFASGQWVGVELDQPRGVNDGSVFGVTYFSCKPQHGIFCQPFALQEA